MSLSREEISQVSARDALCLYFSDSDSDSDRTVDLLTGLVFRFALALRIIFFPRRVAHFC